MFNHNPFRVAQIHVALPQGARWGSALARATLGWELVNAFGVSVRIVTNRRSRSVPLSDTMV